MELVLYVYHSFLLNLDVARVAYDRHAANEVCLYISGRVVEKVYHNECAVFYVHLHRRVVARPDVAHVRAVGVADGCMAVSEEHEFLEVYQSSVLIPYRVGARIVHEYAVCPEEVLREVLCDERLARPAVLDAEIKATSEHGYEFFFAGVILPLSVPLVAET